jgi:hypothetical protein
VERRLCAKSKGFQITNKSNKEIKREKLILNFASQKTYLRGGSKSAPSSSLFYFFLFTLHSYHTPQILVFYFVCRYFPTRSTISTFPLCIHPSISVLCHSSPLWPLLLFVSCVFTLNKSFLIFRSAFMNNL